MRQALGARWEGEFEAGKGAVDVPRYGYIDVPSFVVPLQGHAEVEGACLVNGGGVFCVESVVKVVEVDLGGGADAGVVDHECEGSVAC